VGAEMKEDTPFIIVPARIMIKDWFKDLRQIDNMGDLENWKKEVDEIFLENFTSPEFSQEFDILEIYYKKWKDIIFLTPGLIEVRKEEK
jgi:spore cortex formation protein SpoVR/YcgB (stage V sporulation)